MKCSNCNQKIKGKTSYMHCKPYCNICFNKMFFSKKDRNRYWQLYFEENSLQNAPNEEFDISLNELPLLIKNGKKRLCKNLNRMPLKEDYISMIENICTLQIGHILINKKVRIKVFPDPRFMEKKEEPKN